MNTRTITIKQGETSRSEVTQSEEETHALAQEFAQTLQGGETLALSGDLGAGKTAFVKGLAESFGINRAVTSPTFIVMKVYAVPGDHAIKTLCHIDAYRLEKGTDLEAIGVNDYMGKPGVLTVIEWAERVKDVIPPTAIWMEFSHGEQKNT